VGGTHGMTMLAAEPHISVFLLMVWLPIIALMAVIYLVGYGIGYKRRGLVVAGVSLLAAMVAVGALTTLFSYKPSTIPSASVSYGPNAVIVPATSDRSEAIIPGIISSFSDVAFHADGWRISFGQMLIFAILALVAIRVFSRRARAENCDHREGWRMGRFILVVLVLMFACRALELSHVRSATTRAQLQVQQSLHDRREVERAQRQTAASAVPAPADIQASIEQLWDQINRPKIDLHAGGEDASTMAATDSVVEANRVQLPDHSNHQLAATGSSTTAESLAQTASELGRLVAQVSLIAQQVSDASRVVARSLAASDQSAGRTPVTTLATPPAPPIAAAQPAPPPAARVDALSVAEPKSGKREATAPALNERIGGEPPTLPAAKPRPAWVDEPQKQIGNVLRQVVIAGPYATPEECYAKTDELLKLATDNYVKHFLVGLSDDRPLTTAQEGSPLVMIKNFRSRELEQMGIDLAYIRREIAKDEYLETVERSVGPMKNLYTLLEFSPDVERELRIRSTEVQRESRLTIIGLLSGSVLGMIGLVFGLLQVDTATKGYYSKRLFLCVPAAIIAFITLVAFIAFH
jgi:hypothetical protein